MRISSSLKLVLAGGLIACYSAFAFLTPERADARPVLGQCNICACKSIQAYTALGAAPVDPTWFYQVDLAGSYSLTYQSFSTLQSKVACIGATVQPSTGKVFPVQGPAAAVCAPIPPGGGQTIYMELDGSGKPPPQPLPGATPITQYFCKPN